jgi:UDP-glucose 4-epimerase
MKYLLTGGAGFIGHHITQKLLEDQHQVVAVDNFSTGNKNNIVDFLANKNYTFVMGNAKDPNLLTPLVEKSDVIFNLAASVGVQKIINQPVESIENNIFIASNLLTLAERFKKRILMFSTSEVYGKSPKFPFEEDDDIVLGPYKKMRWSYATSKLIDDFLSRAYFEQNQTAVTMVRLFNTIGTGQVGHYGMVVPRFFDQAMANKTMTVYGTGQQSRCFTDVRDVVNALLSLVDCAKSYGELINIGAQHETKILELAQQIKYLCQSESKIEIYPYEHGYGQNFEDMDRRLPCCEKLASLTGYRMQYSLGDTLGWIYQNRTELMTSMENQFVGILPF